MTVNFAERHWWAKAACALTVSEENNNFFLIESQTREKLKGTEDDMHVTMAHRWALYSSSILVSMVNLTIINTRLSAW